MTAEGPLCPQHKMPCTACRALYPVFRFVQLHLYAEEHDTPVGEDCHVTGITRSRQGGG